MVSFINQKIFKIAVKNEWTGKRVRATLTFSGGRFGWWPQIFFAFTLKKNFLGIEFLCVFSIIDHARVSRWIRNENYFRMSIDHRWISRLQNGQGENVEYWFFEFAQPRSVYEQNTLITFLNISTLFLIDFFVNFVARSIQKSPKPFHLLKLFLSSHKQQTPNNFYGHYFKHEPRFFPCIFLDSDKTMRFRANFSVAVFRFSDHRTNDDCRLFFECNSYDDVTIWQNGRHRKADD